MLLSLFWMRTFSLLASFAVNSRGKQESHSQILLKRIFKGQDKLLEGKSIRMLVLRKSVDVKIQCQRTDALMLVNPLLVIRWNELQEYKVLLLNHTLSYSEA